MKNKVIIAVVIITMILLFSIPNNVEASLTNLANSMHIGQTNAINSSREMTESILGTFQVLGSVVSVIALIIIGMRYVFSSLEEKAQMKGVIGYYITGCVLVFATSNVVGGAWNVLDGIEHNWKSVETAGTCTTAGKITYTCQDPGCGKVKEEKTSKDPNNHVGGWTNGAITRAATCIAKGKRNQKCNGCSATKSVDIPINADNHTHWSAWTETKAATCTAKGWKERTCTDCKVGKDGTEIAKNLSAHKWDNSMPPQEDREKYLRNAATCVSKPQYYHVCGNGCGAQDPDGSWFENGRKDTNNHNFGDWREWISGSATCVKKGTYYRGCNWCGTTQEEDRYNPDNHQGGIEDRYEVHTVEKSHNKIKACNKCDQKLYDASVNELCTWENDSSIDLTGAPPGTKAWKCRYCNNRKMEFQYGR